MYFQEPLPVGTLTKDLGEHHFQLYVSQGGWTLNLVETNSEETVAQWAFDDSYATDEDVFNQGNFGEGAIYQILSSMGYKVHVEVFNG
jgi:hypothetical protein